MDGSQAVTDGDAADGSRQSGCEGTAIVALEPGTAGACGALTFLLGCSTPSYLARCSAMGPVAEAPAGSQAGQRSSPSSSRPSSPVGFGRDLPSRLDFLSGTAYIRHISQIKFVIIFHKSAASPLFLSLRRDTPSFWHLGPDTIHAQLVLPCLGETVSAPAVSQSVSFCLTSL